MSHFIYLVNRPVSGDVIGMTAEELTEYLAIPDHKGLDFKVEVAQDAESHECGEVIQLDAEASARFLEIADQSSVIDGKTYVERMREKADEAHRRHTDDETPRD